MPSDSEARDTQPARDLAREPETSSMTLVTVIAERLLRDRILNGIRDAGSRGFTLTDVTGEGSSEIRAHEWEGPSVKVETLVPGDVADRIVAWVARRYFQHHAVIVYTSEVQVVRAGRFMPEAEDGEDPVRAGDAP